MFDFIKEPWPWYVAGPMIGLLVPLMLYFGKSFGVSSTLRHICAACVPLDIDYFKYNWKDEQWNLYFIVGVLIGGFLAGQFIMGVGNVSISMTTVEDLSALGITNFNSYVPSEVFSWETLLSLRGLVFMVFGGFLVGFGTRYANGCTSGHSISGLSNLQLGSLVATISFFIGGLLMTHVFLPYIL